MQPTYRRVVRPSWCRAGVSPMNPKVRYLCRHMPSRSRRYSLRVAHTPLDDAAVGAARGAGTTESTSSVEVVQPEVDRTSNFKAKIVFHEALDRLDAAPVPVPPRASGVDPQAQP